jgi:hypothetical protein
MSRRGYGNGKVVDFISVNIDLNYETALAAERTVAIQAVLQASKVCQSVFKNLVSGETITKNDKSPVTGKLLLHLVHMFLCEVLTYTGNA